MGRPRKPTHLKVLAGTLEKSRENPKEPPASPVLRIPKPPDDLSEGEKAAWVELAKVVQPLKVATKEDLIAFRQMAITLAVCESAREAINAEGLVYDAVSDRGGISVKKRPEVEILATYKRQLSAELARFGLTPADRSKVSVLGDEGNDEDPLDEFA